MTFDQIWDVLCKKEPKLKNHGAIVEFKRESLRTLLEQVYDYGERRGVQQGQLGVSHSSALEEVLYAARHGRHMR